MTSRSIYHAILWLLLGITLFGGVVFPAIESSSTAYLLVGLGLGGSYIVGTVLLVVLPFFRRPPGEGGDDWDPHTAGPPPTGGPA